MRGKGGEGTSGRVEGDKKKGVWVAIGTDRQERWTENWYGQKQ